MKFKQIIRHGSKVHILNKLTDEEKSSIFHSDKYHVIVSGIGNRKYFYFNNPF